MSEEALKPNFVTPKQKKMMNILRSIILLVLLILLTLPVAVPFLMKLAESDEILSTSTAANLVTRLNTTRFTGSSTSFRSTTVSTTRQASVTNPFFCFNMTIVTDADASGNDIFGNVTTFLGCCNGCYHLSNCKAFVYNFNTNECWLKFRRGIVTRFPGAVLAFQ